MIELASNLCGNIRLRGVLPASSGRLNERAAGVLSVAGAVVAIVAAAVALPLPVVLPPALRAMRVDPVEGLRAE